jgi:hypothetical protein
MTFTLKYIPRNQNIGRETYMRRIALPVVVFVVLLGVVAIGSPVFAQGKKVTSGTVTGGVSAAGGCSALGGLIYIPGRSIIAKLDQTGAFTLYNVPAGDYTLRVELVGDTSIPAYHDFLLTVASSTVAVGTLSINCGGGGNTSCSSDAQCSNVQYCSDSFTCETKKAGGSACATDHECISGVCSGFVCQ